MSVIKNVAAFWYDFIVGDDWLIAVGVVVLLAAAGAVAHAGLSRSAWVLVPVGVAAILSLSLHRATLR